MQQIEQNVLRMGTLITRPLVTIIGTAVLCCLTVVVYFSIEAATLEFTMSVVNRDKGFYEMPPYVARYRQIYSWGWCAPIGGLLGLTLLVCRKKCTLGALVVYIAVTCLFTAIWLTLTLFVFYLGNQCFWVGSGTL